MASRRRHFNEGWVESSLESLEPNLTKDFDAQIKNRRILHGRRLLRQKRLPTDEDNTTENENLPPPKSSRKSVSSIKAATPIKSKASPSNILKENNKSKKSSVRFVNNVSDKQTTSKKISDRKSTPYKLRENFINDQDKSLKSNKLDFHESSNNMVAIDSDEIKKTLNKSSNVNNMKDQTLNESTSKNEMKDKTRKSKSFRQNDSFEIKKQIKNSNVTDNDKNETTSNNEKENKTRKSNSPQTKNVSKKLDNSNNNIKQKKLQLKNIKWKNNVKSSKEKHEIVDVTNLNVLFNEKKEKNNKTIELDGLEDLFNESNVIQKEMKNTEIKRKSLPKSKVVNLNETYSFEEISNVDEISVEINNTCERRGSVKRKAKDIESDSGSKSGLKRRRWTRPEAFDFDSICGASLLHDTVLVDQTVKTPIQKKSMQVIDLITPYESRKKKTIEPQKSALLPSKLTVSKITNRRRLMTNESQQSLLESSNSMSVSKINSTKRRSNSAPTHSTPIEKKPTSKVKIPNFAKIHQRAFDKMEDLQHYQKRKDERAKQLLSGCKPKKSIENSATNKNAMKAKDKTLAATPNKKSKCIRFAHQTPKQVDPYHIPLPNTPLPKIRLDIEDEKSILEDQSRKNNSKLKNKDLHLSDSSRIPLPLKSANIFTIKPANSKSIENNPFVAKDRRLKDNVKEIIKNKKPKVENKITQRRELLKGVRTNKRFELMMKYRENKN